MVDVELSKLCSRVGDSSIFIILGNGVCVFFAFCSEPRNSIRFLVLTCSFCSLFWCPVSVPFWTVCPIGPLWEPNAFELKFRRLTTTEIHTNSCPNTDKALKIGIYTIRHRMKFIRKRLLYRRLVRTRIAGVALCSCWIWGFSNWGAFL